jgi:putative hydrolase
MRQPDPPTAPMSPLEALRRVCFLLERGRESRYRVDAFR